MSHSNWVKAINLFKNIKGIDKWLNTPLRVINNKCPSSLNNNQLSRLLDSIAKSVEFIK